MALVYPTLENIRRLKVKPEDGEWYLTKYLARHLDDTYEIFFNPSLNGDRPDIVILKEDSSIILIEVKDWNLEAYSIDENNKWRVLKSKTPKQSPHAQVFKYKDQLYDLHLPRLGLKNLQDKKFYKLVDCYVYFHDASSDDLDNFYRTAKAINLQKKEKLHDQMRCKSGDEALDFKNKYDKALDHIIKMSKNLDRDLKMSFGHDNLSSLIRTITRLPMTNKPKFEKEIYRDFKRRLCPSDHTLKQGIKIELDKKQLGLCESKIGFEKLKGVAGCGKTTVLAQRAINSYKRHGQRVLILTFNITLIRFIEDKLSDIQGHRNLVPFEIANYHQFYNSQINNTEQKIEDLIRKHTLDKLYGIDVFEGHSTIKYKTILIDEVQDYDSSWVNIIKNQFLDEDGEMVLFGEESQTIYDRDEPFQSRKVRGFGRWNKLNRSYRTSYDSPLNQLFQDFQLTFLSKKYIDASIFEAKSGQLGMGFSTLAYVPISDLGWQDTVFESIKELISAYSLHPNDIVIISGKKRLLRSLEFLWSQEEETNCMLATYRELSNVLNMKIERIIDIDGRGPDSFHEKAQEKIDKADKLKKRMFFPNRGKIKFSTAHSFKGLESKTVFYIMDKEDEPELVYTAATRSSENLVIFDIACINTCTDFFVSSQLLSKQSA